VTSQGDDDNSVASFGRANYDYEPPVFQAEVTLFQHMCVHMLTIC
jgi:hypothetical protein